MIWVGAFTFFAIGTSVLNFLAMIVIGWSGIWNGQGIGSFSALWFLVYGATSTAAWMVGFVVSRQRRLDLVYWTTLAMPVILFLSIPVKFYVE